MLTPKPWKPEAIVRLVLSVMICVFAGSVVVTVVTYVRAAHGGAGRWIFFALAAGALAALAGALGVVSRPWPLAQFSRRLMVFLGCLYGGLLLGAGAQRWADGGDVAQSLATAFVSTLFFQGLALVLIWRFLREHHIGWRDAFGLTASGLGWALLLGVTVAVVAVPVGWTLQWGSAEVLMRFRIPPQEQPAIQMLRITESWPDRLYLGFAAVLLAPVAEEMLFRGILYPAIKQGGYPRLALWGTALLFAATHYHLATFVPLVLLAVALTWLYERTNNLLAPIAAHGVFNGINFVMLYLMQRPGDLS